MGKYIYVSFFLFRGLNRPNSPGYAIISLTVIVKFILNFNFYEENVKYSGTEKGNYNNSFQCLTCQPWHSKNKASTRIVWVSLHLITETNIFSL